MELFFGLISLALLTGNLHRQVAEMFIFHIQTSINFPKTHILKFAGYSQYMTKNHMPEIRSYVELSLTA